MAIQLDDIKTCNLPGSKVAISLDEVQRVPGLFASIKLAVDRNRYPGRFILTGFANVLLLPRLSDSLAGRIDMLFDGDVGTYRTDRLGDQIADLVATGGYPEAHARTGTDSRSECNTESSGNRFKSGIVHYDGEELLPFGERLWAIPLGRVWDKG